jgi:hypothetical protein
MANDQLKQTLAALNDMARDDVETTDKLILQFQNDVDPNAILCEIDGYLADNNVFSVLASLMPGSEAPFLSFVQHRHKLSVGDRIALDRRVSYMRDTLDRANGMEPSSSKSKMNKAIYSDYVAWFQADFKIKRDLISEEALIYDPLVDKWVPVENRIEHFRSIAHDSKFYQVGKVSDHLKKYALSLKPELLIEIPAWDKRDRVMELAQCIQCNNFDTVDVYELLCDWGAKMWRRIHRPIIRNRLLVLKGKQELGKDWLINALTGGLGDYVQDLTLDRELERKIHTGIIFTISEFDKTSKTHVGTIKDIVTKASSHERLSHDRRPEKRHCRASFIASVNPSDVLRDFTGNSRFILLDIDFIKWDYPGAEFSPTRDEDRLQIIAQFRNFAENGFQCSHDANAKNKCYIDERTPDDPSEIILEWWHYEANKMCDEDSINGHKWRAQGWIPNNKLYPLARKIKEIFAKELRQFQTILSSNGLRTRNSKIRGYKFNSNVDSETESDEQVFY